MAQHLTISRLLLLLAWAGSALHPAPAWCQTNPAPSAPPSAEKPSFNMSEPPSPGAQPQPYFAPPPVPRFMLIPPSRPLSQDEMMQQAREAEEASKRSAPSQK